MKWKQIRKETYAQFLEWRENFITVRGRDICDHAITVAGRIGLNGFKVWLCGMKFPNFNFQASSHWLHSFKKEHKIVSRKVTKFIDRRSVEGQHDTDKSAAKFRKRALRLIKEVDPNMVLNTDQMGMNLEFASKRTLSVKGEKDTYGRVQRINPTKHSFTVQMMISLSGGLAPRLLVCFYEPNGAPQKFDRELEPFFNLYCVWSRSGLMNKDLEYDYLEYFTGTIDEGCIFIHDAWNGYNVSLSDSEITAKFEHVLELPPKTTAITQPLDVGVHIYFKQMVKHIHNEVRLKHDDFVIMKRVNLAKVISLVYFQFCSPRFENLIRYAWYKSGLLLERPPGFVTPYIHCFKFPVTSKCTCGEPCFIQCARCDKLLCFNCFVTEYHICQ
jgi:hypothetical protein